MEALEPTAALHVGALVLITVQRTRVETARECGVAWMSVSAEPTALVIGAPTGWRAMAMDGSELVLEQLLDEVPGLRDRMR